jgi:hypothetical protein
MKFTICRGQSQTSGGLWGMIISTGKLYRFEEKPVPQTSHEPHGTEPRLCDERSQSLTAWAKARSPNFKVNSNNTNIFLPGRKVTDSSWAFIPLFHRCTTHTVFKKSVWVGKIMDRSLHKAGKLTEVSPSSQMVPIVRPQLFRSDKGAHYGAYLTVKWTQAFSHKHTRTK